MASCQCDGIEVIFSEKMAKRELKNYRKKGPSGLTKALITFFKDQGLEGHSLLDIGGGVGVIQHELVAAGAGPVTNVDGSSGYIAACREEAELRKYADRATYHHGDFVELADQVAQADIVTLDKVLCCYDDIDSLVKSSAAKAGQYYAVIYPQDKWWTQIIRAFGFLVSIIYRTTFQTFIHSTDHVDRLIRSSGLKPIHTEKKMFWQMVIYGR